MAAEPTENAKAFMDANDESKVVEGRVLDMVTRGGEYVLQNGKRFKLSKDDANSLPEGYPKWGHD